MTAALTQKRHLHCAHSATVITAAVLVVPWGVDRSEVDNGKDKGQTDSFVRLKKRIATGFKLNRLLKNGPATDALATMGRALMRFLVAVFG